MKKIILLFLALLTLTGCSNINSNDSTTDENQFAGPLISGIYEFTTYNDMVDFYNIFEVKNTEKFLLLNLDSLNSIVKYFFISSGVNSSVIYNKIYDYDFPHPSFEIVIDSMTLYLFDISNANFSNNPIYSIQIDNKYNDNQYKFYIDNFEVGLLQSENIVELDFVNYLNDKFKEVFENA